jgi:hypothetical protein
MPSIEYFIVLLYLALLTANIFTVEFDASCEELLLHKLVLAFLSKEAKKIYKYNKTATKAFNI